MVDTSRPPLAELATEDNNKDRIHADNETIPKVAVSEIEDIVRTKNVGH